MSKKYFISRNYRSKFDAAGKAKIDCETILSKSGWKNIGFKQTNFTGGLIGTLISAFGLVLALIRLKPGSEICLQYPFNKFYRMSVWGACLKKCKIITIVHDVYGLKKRHKDPASEIGLLSKSDVLIVHNEQMAGWFKEHRVNSQLVSLDIFDYLHNKEIDKSEIRSKEDKIRIVFAGNMGGAKSFIYDLDTLEQGNYKFDLYGVGFDPDSVINVNQTSLDFKGKFPSDKVIDAIFGEFGLVWYGDSLDSCSSDVGQYLKFNNPHKLSLYLLCEMPIIIWDQAAMADFVSQKGIGITVSSLNDLPKILSDLSLQDIAQMKANVLEIREKIKTGWFLLQALDKASSY